MIRIFAFLFLFFLTFGSVAQKFNIRHYNVEDGLGQSQVYSICQDVQGRIWLGTRGGGISVFDGYEFSPFEFNQNLANPYINKLIKDDEGTIWIGTNEGLQAYIKGEIKNVTGGGIDKAVIRDIKILSQGLICATSKGLYTVSNGYKAHPISNTLSSLAENISTLEKDKDGTIWYGNNTGLHALDVHGKIIHYREISPYMKNAITIIRFDSQGNLWIGTYGDGVYLYNGKTFSRIDYHHELYKETILDIVFDNEKVLIATLTKGLVEYNKSSKSFSFVTENEGLSNNHLRCVYSDQFGDLWLGSSGGGINHYLGKYFTTYDERSGLRGAFIYSVIKDKTNAIWVGNSQNGVSKMSSDTLINFTDLDGYSNVKVKALTEDKNGNIWAGTDGKGVFVYKDSLFQEIYELKGAYVKDMVTDQKGNVWIATAGSGLIKIVIRNDNFIISKYLISNGLLSNRLSSLHVDKKNRIWYGSESNGVSCVEGSNLKKYVVNAKNGLTNELVRTLTEDSLGRLWIGTAGGGLFHYPLYTYNKKIYRLTTSSGLSSDNIYLLTTDASGNLLVGSEKGLDHLYFNENGQLIQLRQYGKQDGFTGVETCQNAVFNEKNGAIWFGTINGLSRFKPNEVSRNQQPPILTFRSIRLNYEPLINEDSSAIIRQGLPISDVQLNYDENRLTFDFIGINLRRPEKVLYQWKLSGVDDDWSPPSKDRSIMYSNINPGKYTFMVRAANEDGVWNKEPLSFSFEIDAPFWKKTWFIAMSIAGALFIIGLSYFLLVRRIRKKAREKQHQIELEKNVLELQQKALRLQMNPHFIFNAMNSIQSLIGTGRENDARYYLAKFSRLMRQILTNSRQHLISLEEEIATLENYLLIESFCNDKRFTYEIVVDDTLEVDFLEIPPMLIQPFVENSIKHGMREKTSENPGKIELSFTSTNKVLTIAISDDGIGRAKAGEINKESKETYHESTSLKVTKERLESLGNTEVKGKLKIVDLEKDGQAIGTKVIIEIPIE